MSIAVLTLAALSFLFASLLVLAHRKLHVDEDPRIDAVLAVRRTHLASVEARRTGVLAALGKIRKRRGKGDRAKATAPIK